MAITVTPTYIKLFLFSFNKSSQLFGHRSNIIIIYTSHINVFLKTFYTYMTVLFGLFIYTRGAPTIMLPISKETTTDTGSKLIPLDRTKFQRLNSTTIEPASSKRFLA